jgi:hypothetical protein
MPSKLQETQCGATRWVTFEPKDHPDLVEQVKILCEDIANEGTKLAENYSLKRFDLENQIAISLGFVDDKIVSMATLHRRPIYGDKVLRTMNRYWKKPEFKLKTAVPNKTQIASLAIIPHHVNIAKKYNYQSLFISRQEEARRYFIWLSKIFKQELNMNWTVHDQKVQVCNPASNTLCWQYIIYHSFDNITQPMPVKYTK